VNFTAANNNIVRNYFKDDIINGEQDPTLDVWDGLFDFGDPNMQYQRVGLNYELPINKIPTFNFLTATYSYTGDFQWQKGSDLFRDLELNGQSYDLGNTIQNSNTHTLNTALDMNRLYSYLGIRKKTARTPNRIQRTNPPGEQAAKTPASSSKKKNTLLNFGIDVLTSIKRVQVNYTENNGSFLPGYLLTPGFIGTLKPTLGYTFGSQSDIREMAARKGWLTVFPEFNQQYTTTQNRQLDFSLNLEPINDLKIDLVGNRLYAQNYTENFRVEDIDDDGQLDYN